MGQYFVTTLMNGIIKLAPLVAFIIGAYFVFIKLPFLFLRKSMHEQKQKLQDENKNLKVVEEKYTVEDYKEFQRKMKLMNPPQQPDRLKSIAGESQTKKEEQKREQSKQERKAEQKSEQKKEAPVKPMSKGPSDEEILGYHPGQQFTQAELKKRYIELIRQNHPDKVASMGPDFKKLAEKNTKEINKAFENLKKKAS